MNEGAPQLLLTPLTLGPRSPRRGHLGNVRRSARTTRASSLHAHGRGGVFARCVEAHLAPPSAEAMDGEGRLWLWSRRRSSQSAFNEPRHDLANPGREARRARRPGCVLLTSGILPFAASRPAPPFARGKVKGYGNKRTKKSWITICIRSLPFGPFAARMFASASCLRSPPFAGMTSEEQAA